MAHPPLCIPLAANHVVQVPGPGTYAPEKPKTAAPRPVIGASERFPPDKVLPRVLLRYSKHIMACVDCGCAGGGARAWILRTSRVRTGAVGGVTLPPWISLRAPSSLLLCASGGCRGFSITASERRARKKKFQQEVITEDPVPGVTRSCCCAVLAHGG